MRSLVATSITQTTVEAPVVWRANWRVGYWEVGNSRTVVLLVDTAAVEAPVALLARLLRVFSAARAPRMALTAPQASNIIPQAVDIRLEVSAEAWVA